MPWGTLRALRLYSVLELRRVYWEMGGRDVLRQTLLKVLTSEEHFESPVSGRSEPGIPIST